MTLVNFRIVGAPIAVTGSNFSSKPLRHHPRIVSIFTNNSIPTNQNHTESIQFTSLLSSIPSILLQYQDFIESLHIYVSPSSPQVILMLISYSPYIIALSIPKFR